MRAIVCRRNSSELVSLATVEDPNDEHVREAFDVQEAFLKLGNNFKNPLRVMLRARTFRNLNGLGVWRTNVTDRLKCKHGQEYYRESCGERAKPSFESRW